MTFYYAEEENALEGNRGEEYAEIDEDGNLVLDIDDMSRGAGKLKEMKRAIEDAIEANE